MTGDQTSRANLIGSFWMTAAMAGFAVEDALLKAAAQTIPVAQVMVVFGLGGAAVFAAIAKAQRARLWSSDIVAPAMRIRAVFEVLGRLFYTLAVALTPLTATTAILQATPLVVVAGAAMFFGERVGWRRWAAVIVGLLGVLIVIRPGTGDFSWMSFLAVLGMIGFAGRDLASRAAPSTLSVPVLGVWGFLAIVLAGILYAFWEGRDFVWPGSDAGMYLGAAILCGVFGYGGLMRAMRTGELASVAPFRYTRLLFGVALGVVVFGEPLDAAMIAGCTVIVAAGLFILGRTPRRVLPEDAA